MNRFLLGHEGSWLSISSYSLQLLVIYWVFTITHILQSCINIGSSIMYPVDIFVTFFFEIFGRFPKPLFSHKVSQEFPLFLFFILSRKDFIVAILKKFCRLHPACIFSSLLLLLVSSSSESSA